MNIHSIQISIVNKLNEAFQLAGSTYKAKHLPETSKEFDLSLQNPTVYVVYVGSEADRTISADVIAQPRRLHFNIECHNRKLYDETGSFTLRDVTEQVLIGFCPLNCRPLYLLRDDTSLTEDSAFWIHVLQLECETLLIQKEASDPIIIPSFKEITNNY